jgi:hypothetical protein
MKLGSFLNYPHQLSPAARITAIGLPFLFHNLLSPPLKPQG